MMRLAPEELLYCMSVTSCHDRTLDPYLIPPNSPERLQPSDLRMKRPRAATRCSSTWIRPGLPSLASQLCLLHDYLRNWPNQAQL